MKVRIGFVSNSSSSSFVLNKYYLSAFQLDNLKDPSSFFLVIATNEYNYTDEDMWSYDEDTEEIKFSTYMNNFDLEGFAEWLGVPEKAFIKRDL